MKLHLLQHRVTRHAVGICVTVLVSMMLASCQAENEVTPDQSVELLAEGTTFIVETETSIAGMYVPIGTQVTARSGGYDFVFPKEAPYYYMDQEDNILVTTSGGVNCTCTQGSGCDPARVNGEFVCAIKSGCTACTRKPAFEFASEPKAGVRGGFIDSRKGWKVDADGNLEKTNLQLPEFWTETDVFSEDNIQFLKQSGSLMDDMALLSFLGFDESVEDSFESYLQKNGVETNWVRATIYGIPAMVLVPGEITAIEFKAAFAKAASASCTCNSGSNGCKLKRSWTVVYCDSAPCTSCTLND